MKKTAKKAKPATKKFGKVILPSEVCAALEASPKVFMPDTREELYRLSLGPEGGPIFNVDYEANGEMITEAVVTRCRNGIAVNYPEDYMRRRDPKCMHIADDRPTDKTRYRDTFGEEFAPVRQETLDWLAKQELVVVPFKSGALKYGSPSLAIMPVNSSFFALTIRDLSGWITFEELGEFEPRAIIYVAPPFRHTHFDHKQVVVHDRSEILHEVWAYNLYPGPSAKKGVFSVLLDIGEQEGWLTAHASSVRVTTPYDNETVVMHEGASGGGKSEMYQDLRREDDGRILLGTNVVTKEPYYITLNESCELSPVTDDMTLCHPAIQWGDGRMVVSDAEDGWFVRVDSLTSYGEEAHFERACIHPDAPLVFYNIEGVPDATVLPWEHSLDSTGKPCPNPRVVIPRRMIHRIVDEPEPVDVRTFGVRMPPCTREKPTYGIMGMTHFVPPSVAWLWRLIAPRGDKNPSIGESKDAVQKLEHGGLIAEGVGSFWPFSTGTKVVSANMQLAQILDHPRTRFILTPNQHIGAYQVGFNAEWLTREWVARRGAGRMRTMEHLAPARCPLFGYAPTDFTLDGQLIRRTLFMPEEQSQVGEAAYDKGAKILTDFFKQELKQFLTDDLDPLGREIIQVCLNDGTIEDYNKITPMYL